MKTSLSLKKLTAVLTALIMLFSVMPVTTWATDADVQPPAVMETPKRFYASAENVKGLETLVNMNELRSYLFEQFANCPDSVNVSKFKIPYTSENAQALRSFIWYEMPELFHVYALGENGYQS